jgi:SAM-dependent methyltransferase
MWYCGTRFKPRKLYGEYPGNFLTRALAVFPNAKDILHCPCGSVSGPGITVDIKRESYVQPQIIADASALPFRDECFDLILSDPPYTEADAKIYGCEKFPMGKFMAESWRILKNGAYLGILHIWYPAFKRGRWKIVGAIGVMTGFARQIRVFSIFQKINGDNRSLF